MNTLSPFTFLLLLILSPIWAFGQANQSVDLVGGIDFSYRFLHEEQHDIPISFIDFRAGEAPRIKWRAGFNFNKRLQNRIFLKTGFRFANIGYYGKKNTLRWGSQHDGNGGFIADSTSLLQELQTNRSYYFLEIPLIIRIELGEKRLSTYLEAGLSGAVNLGLKTQVIADIESFNSINNTKPNKFNNIHIVANMAFGFNYTLNSNYQLFGQPTIRLHLTRLINGALLHEHLFSSGLEVGLRRKF